MPVTKFRFVGGNECIGEVNYSIENTDKRILRLNLILLEEKYRGKGYGQTIMNDVIKKAKRLGCDKIILSVENPEYDVFSSYELRRKFFEKLGFKFDDHGFGELTVKNFD